MMKLARAFADATRSLAVLRKYSQYLLYFEEPYDCQHKSERVQLNSLVGNLVGKDYITEDRLG